MSITFAFIMNNQIDTFYNENEEDTGFNRIIQAEEFKSELNYLENEFNKRYKVIDEAIDSLSMTYDLIDILKNDELTDLSIKVLSTNKFYTDVYKLGLESFNSNEVAIEALGDMARKAFDNIVNAFKKMYRFFKEWILKWYNRVEYFDNETKRLAEECGKIDDKTYDHEGAKDKEISVIPNKVVYAISEVIKTINPSIEALNKSLESAADEIDREDILAQAKRSINIKVIALKDITKGNLNGTKVEKEKGTVDSFYSDIRNGLSSTWYKNIADAKDLRNNVDTLKKLLDEKNRTQTETAFKNKDVKQLASLKKEQFEFIGLFRFTGMKLIDLQRNYISIATAVLRFANKKKEK